MRAMTMRTHLYLTGWLVLTLGVPAFAQDGQGRPAAAAQTQGQASARSLGLDVFGGAGITWPAAADSFEAVGLESQSIEFGGGARVTGLWRQLFAQVTVHRWKDAGERSFVDSTGARFPLGIPLNVKATYVDVSAGWKTPVVTRTGRTALWSYVAAGVGAAMYSEASPFAGEGEDLDTSSVSYNMLIGVEIPLGRWLAVAVDARYRFVPDILGDGGVSAALGEDTLGGFHTSVGLRVGFGRAVQPRATPPPLPPPVVDLQTPPDTPPAKLDAPIGVVVRTAPVYLLPDASRIPLRILEPGTSIRIFETTQDWVRVEFNDPQFGPRVGYIERRFVQLK